MMMYGHGNELAFYEAKTQKNESWADRLRLT
jgi:hypothetical protein